MENVKNAVRNEIELAKLSGNSQHTMKALGIIEGALCLVSKDSEVEFLYNLRGVISEYAYGTEEEKTEAFKLISNL